MTCAGQRWTGRKEEGSTESCLWAVATATTTTTTRVTTTKNKTSTQHKRCEGMYMVEGHILIAARHFLKHFMSHLVPLDRNELRIDREKSLVAPFGSIWIERVCLNINHLEGFLQRFPIGFFRFSVGGKFVRLTSRDFSSSLKRSENWPLATRSSERYIIRLHTSFDCK